MATTIAIEVKPVELNDIDTPFSHLYLVRTVTDADGTVVSEKVIRGGPDADLNLVTQSNADLALSEDARGSATPAERRHTVLDLDGRDPDAVWSVMVQHAATIGRAGLSYGPDRNSNTVVQSALFTVGINLVGTLPAGTDPGEVPGYRGVAGIIVNDRLLGSSLNDFIRGGVGNDFIDGRGGNDRLLGDIGFDTLVGGVGNDRLDGGLLADRMIGGFGNDTYIVDGVGDRVVEGSLSPGGGRDLIMSGISLNLAREAGLAGVERVSLAAALNLNVSGNGLDNLLSGNVGANTLSGRGGDDDLSGRGAGDVLLGGAGADVLRGGLGADRLEGGAGRDILSGGDGADAFVFASAGHSGPGGAARDQVADFGAADLLDLTGIDARVDAAGNQSFAFIGTGAFTAAGQVRFTADGPGNALVEANVDADLAAEFEILLKGSGPLTRADFLL